MRVHRVVRSRNGIRAIVLASLVLAATVFALAFPRGLGGAAVTLQTNKVTKQQVVVAAKPLAAGRLLTAEDLRIELRAVEAIPANSAFSMNDVVGKKLEGELAAGSSFLLANLRTVEPPPAPVARSAAAPETVAAVREVPTAKHEVVAVTDAPAVKHEVAAVHDAPADKHEVAAAHEAPAAKHEVAAVVDVPVNAPVEAAAAHAPVGARPAVMVLPSIEKGPKVKPLEPGKPYGDRPAPITEPINAPTKAPVAVPITAPVTKPAAKPAAVEAAKIEPPVVKEVEPAAHAPVAYGRGASASAPEPVAVRAPEQGEKVAPDARGQLEEPGASQPRKGYSSYVWVTGGKYSFGIDEDGSLKSVDREGKSAPVRARRPSAPIQRAH